MGSSSRQQLTPILLSSGISVGTKGLMPFDEAHPIASFTDGGIDLPEAWG